MPDASLDLDQVFGIIRTSPLARMIPVEATVSLPLPEPLEGRLCLCSLIYSATRDRQTGQVRIFRPFAAAVVDPAEKAVLEIRDLEAGFGQTASSEPIGLGEAGKHFGLDEADGERDLWKTLSEVAGWVGHLGLPGQPPLSEAQRGQVRHLAELLDGILAPCLRPHFEELCPSFFALLREAGPKP